MAVYEDLRYMDYIPVKLVLYTLTSVLVLTSGKPASVNGPVIVQRNQCSALVDHRLINLAPLARRGFYPRFQDRFRGWTYSFNPCLPLNVPDDPSMASGDRCEYVSMCKSKRKRHKVEAYTLGIQHLVTFEMIKPRKNKVQSSSSFSSSETTSPVVNGNTVDREGMENTSHDAESSTENTLEGNAQEGKNNKEKDIDMNGLGEEDDDTEAEKVYKKDGELLYPGDEIVIDEDEAENERNDGAFGSGGTELGNVDEEDEEEEVFVSLQPLMKDSEENAHFRVTKSAAFEAEITVRDGREEEGGGKNEGHGEEAGKEEEGEEEEEDDSGDDNEEEEEEEEEKEEEDEEDEGDDDDDDEEDDEDEVIVHRKRKGRRRKGKRDRRETVKKKRKRKGKVLTLKMAGRMSYEMHTTYIYLICDSSLRRQDAGKFKVIDSDQMSTHIELRHLCCCPDSCIEITTYNNSGGALTSAVQEGDVQKRASIWPPHEITWVVVTIFLILLVAIIIGSTCCRSGGTRGPYTTLPAIHGTRSIHASRLTLDSQESFRIPALKFPSPDYLDYDTPKLKKGLPQIENGIIKSQDLEIRQRLGGGLFGDTYLGELGDRAVSAKRLTVGVHQGQLTEMDLARLQDAVCTLSRFRHKHVVCVLGICCELRQPHIIKEFVDGESLRDLLLGVTDGSLTFYRKVKMLTQAAEGMHYLHSGKQSVLHRDLRCANLLVSKADDHVQITDFGMVQLLHRLRVQCTGRKGCYCRKETPAWPASIRWTAPEVLTHPTSEESDTDVFSPACDVYSFALTMWEAVSVSDPWCELQDESMVVQTVLQGVRPDVSQLPNLPQSFISVMQAAWHEAPEKRPQFKQIMNHLISVAKQTSKEERKRRDSNSSTMTYFRSALNISVEKP